MCCRYSDLAHVDVKQAVELPGLLDADVVFDLLRQVLRHRFQLETKTRDVPDDMLTRCTSATNLK